MYYHTRLDPNLFCTVPNPEHHISVLSINLCSILGQAHTRPGMRTSLTYKEATFCLFFCHVEDGKVRALFYLIRTCPLVCETNPRNLSASLERLASALV